MEKYKFTEEKMFYNGRVLKRIIRIEDNLVGGWIESEKNLSQSGKCFVYDNAIIYGNEKINHFYRERTGVKHQLLHAYRMIFADGRCVEAAPPDDFNKAICYTNQNATEQ